MGDAWDGDPGDVPGMVFHSKGRITMLYGSVFFDGKSHLETDDLGDYDYPLGESLYTIHQPVEWNVDSWAWD